MALVAIVLVWSLQLGCGSGARESQEQAHALAGQWIGTNEAGTQQLWLGLWGDGRYDCRITETSAPDSQTVQYAHQGRWRLRAREAGPPIRYAIRLDVRSSDEAARTALPAASQDLEFLREPGATAWQIRSPWGVFRVDHDMGA